jgi:hypothetical protein
VQKPRGLSLSKSRTVCVFFLSFFFIQFGITVLLSTIALLQFTEIKLKIQEQHSIFDVVVVWAP